MNDIEPDYNDLDSFWIDFKEILNNLDNDLDSLPEFILELDKDEDEEEESDKHPLNELIKDIH